MEPTEKPSAARNEPGFFYGWYIVGAGFLSYIAFAFSFSSTLSVFVKPVTEDLGVSRGLFSLLRTGEIFITGLIAPIVGPLVDRYGGRWLMAIGALVAGGGFVLLGQAGEFWQFLLSRWIFVTIGAAFMGNLVINVTIAQWFIRKRGRAIAIASMGQGIAKVGIPLFAASLFLWLGWRNTWVLFGILTWILAVGPTLLFMRRRPEEMGLHPDGATTPTHDLPPKKGSKIASEHQPAIAGDRAWNLRETLATQAFWLISFTFGISNVGIAGLNLHVFAYVTDIGHSAIVAATAMSIIALTQFSSALFWGLVSERGDIRRVTMLKFLIQAAGLSLALASRGAALLYLGFFLYGIGLGGSQVLQEIIWANYFGRISLGKVRGWGFFITHCFAAAGPPFFGFLFDLTSSYFISFTLFTAALILSAILILLVRPPIK